MEWSVMPIEPPNYFVALSPDLFQQEQARVRERFESAVELAEQAFATELQRLTAHLAERLTGLTRRPAQGVSLFGRREPSGVLRAVPAAQHQEQPRARRTSEPSPASCVWHRAAAASRFSQAPADGGPRL